jgi:hypothetical protein
MLFFSFPAYRIDRLKKNKDKVYIIEVLEQMVKKQRLIRKTSRVTTISIIALAIIATIVLSYYFITFFNKPPTNISNNED